jgi:hypothetical protein
VDKRAIVAKTNVTVSPRATAIVDRGERIAGSGDLYVAIAGRRGEVVTRLDRSGKAVRGWPILLADVDGCDQLLPVIGGESIRVLCLQSRISNDDSLVIRRSFAIDTAGRTSPGWPVDVDNGTIGNMVGDDLVMLVNPLMNVGGQAGESWPVNVTTIGLDGSVEKGVDVPFVWCDLGWAIGTDALAYGTSHRDWTSASSVKTDVTAFGAGSVGPGWPITLDGNASDVAFDGSLGLAHLVIGSPNEPPTRTVVLDDDGSVLASGSADQPIVSTSTWNGAGADYPGPPIVASDGSTFIVSTAERRTTVMALDPDGKARAGWPYHLDLGMQWTGTCYAATPAAASVARCPKSAIRTCAIS